MVQMFDYTAGAAPCDYKGGQRRHLKVCRLVRHLNQTLGVFFWRKVQNYIIIC